MSNDIVKKLRDSCACNLLTSPCGAEDDCRREAEAADRIEELEAALKFYAEDHAWPNDGPWGIDSNDFGNVARAALEQLENGKD